MAHLRESWPHNSADASGLISPFLVRPASASVNIAASPCAPLQQCGCAWFCSGCSARLAHGLRMASRCRCSSAIRAMPPPMRPITSTIRFNAQSKHSTTRTASAPRSGQAGIWPHRYNHADHHDRRAQRPADSRQSVDAICHLHRPDRGRDWSHICYPCHQMPPRMPAD
jgi:hypothetical protein